jgi:hypothetical protein
MRWFQRPLQYERFYLRRMCAEWTHTRGCIRQEYATLICVFQEHRAEKCLYLTVERHDVICQHMRLGTQLQVTQRLQSSFRSCLIKPHVRFCCLLINAEMLIWLQYIFWIKCEKDVLISSAKMIQMKILPRIEVLGLSSIWRDYIQIQLKLHIPHWPVSVNRPPSKDRVC